MTVDAEAGAEGGGFGVSGIPYAHSTVRNKN